VTPEEPLVEEIVIEQATSGETAVSSAVPVEEESCITMTLDVADATFSGDVSSSDNAGWEPHAGYTGRGHTGFWNDGGKVEWNVQMSQAETKQIKFRYAAAPGGTAPLAIFVNGNVIEPAYEFPATGSWTDWQDSPVFEVSMIAGQNTITL